jgi:hypothetical protein
MDVRVDEPTAPARRGRHGAPPSGPVGSGCFGVMGAWSASPGLSAFSQLRGRAGTGYGNEAHALAQRRCLTGLSADQIYSQVPANRHVRQSMQVITWYMNEA